MTYEILRGVMIPFIGTSLGALCVLFMKKEIDPRLQRILAGFSAGVMVASSVWSLLIPAIEQSENGTLPAFMPASLGLFAGFVFLTLTDRFIFTLQNRNSSGSMMFFAVTLHNLPEGMAVGVIIAGYLSANSLITQADVLALSLGIAIQNFPEGAIISLPLHSAGASKGKSLLMGIISGIVEPVGAFITILAAGLIVPALPYLLAFAAGAMLYVVTEELVPEMHEKGFNSHIGVLSFAVGFMIMMILDVALG